MKNNKVLISVGITAFNCAKYLQDAINSVLDQNTEHWSGIIVLDGGADRDTTHIFQEFEHPKFQKYVFKENQGPYGTRAKAIELSKTEWYYQLDGDDILPKNAIQLVIDAINDNPDAEFVYGDCNHFDERRSFMEPSDLSRRSLFCLEICFSLRYSLNSLNDLTFPFVEKFS